MEIGDEEKSWWSSQQFMTELSPMNFFFLFPFSPFRLCNDRDKESEEEPNVRVIICFLFYFLFFLFFRRRMIKDIALCVNEKGIKEEN